MKNYEVLSNGIEIVYAFGSLPNKKNKKIFFLAGTTSWNSDLLNESWRRYFIAKISKEKNIKSNIVFCIPEPQYGQFTESSSRHLIDWETEYLDLATTHIYWLNTYWTYQNAIRDVSVESQKYFTDGEGANIGVTVRFEIGASFSRQKFSYKKFSVILGAPEDAQGLAWLEIQSKLLAIPIYWLRDKNNILSDDWYNSILKEIR